MRTKTLLVTALVGLAGLSAAIAQTTNIYSVNVVGYVTVTVSNYGTVQRVLGTPLGPVANTNNFLSLLIPTTTEGSQASKLTELGYFASTYYDGLGWDNEMELPVGAGWFISLGWGGEGFPTPPPITVVFVGEVQQKSASDMTIPGTANPPPNNNTLSLIASLVPMTFTLNDPVNGVPAREGCQISLLDEFGNWLAATYYDGLGWDNDLQVDVAKGFFYNNNGAGIPWTRNFEVK